MSNELLKVNFDMRELKKAVKDLEKAQKKVDNFIEDCTKKLAAVLISKTQDDTPRVTTNLAWRWTNHTNPDSLVKSGPSAEEWAQNAIVERKGNEYIITVSNPTEYAPYVEYGHRTPGGKGWVPGQFMLKINVAKLNRDAPRLLEPEIRQFVESFF